MPGARVGVGGAGNVMLDVSFVTWDVGYVRILQPCSTRGGPQFFCLVLVQASAADDPSISQSPSPWMYNFADESSAALLVQTIAPQIHLTFLSKMFIFLSAIFCKARPCATLILDTCCCRVESTLTQLAATINNILYIATSNLWQKMWTSNVMT